MAGSNDIDKLFKSKLAGSQAGYSESAWNEASQMLDKHYRIVFLRKLFWFAIPVLLMGTVGVSYYFGDSAEVSHSEISIQATHSKEKATHELQNFADESTNASTVAESIEILSASNVAHIDGVTAEIEIIDESESSVEPKTVSANNDRTLKSIASATSVSNPINAAKSNQPNDLNVLLKDYNLNGRNAISTELASIILKQNLNKMSIADLPFDGLPDSTVFTGEMAKEPLMNELRKVQFFGDGGLLVARGMHDLKGNRQSIGFGLHASILTRYNLAQSVYLDLRAGIYNRGALTPTAPFAGSNAGTLITVKPLSLNYASIFIGTGYRVGARHSFGGGLEFNPMIGVIGKKQKQLAGEKPSESSYVIDNTGYNGLDAAIILNYRVSIAERVDATAEVHLGLFDATDNAVFNTGDIDDLNTLFKAGISYRLSSR